MVIYKFSLKDNIDISPMVKDKIKLMAYLVYSGLSDYENEMYKNVLFKDNIIFNELFDGNSGHFEFEHEDFETGIYEPFMIDDVSFGFTIYDGSISKDDLMMIYREVMKNIRFEYELDLKEIKVLDSDDRINKIESFYLGGKKLSREKED